MGDPYERYTAATETIQSTLAQYVREETPLPELMFQATIGISLSNLAVAEAIHMLREQLSAQPVEITTTGSVTLDPEAVAATVRKILGRRE